jgi:hypothetical protein
VLAHGKEIVAVQKKSKHTAKASARQRGGTAHGKEEGHGKDTGKHTAMKTRTAKRTNSCRAKSFAVRRTRSHGKAAFAVQFLPLPCALFHFLFFLYIVLILMLIFILEI